MQTMTDDRLTFKGGPPTEEELAVAAHVVSVELEAPRELFARGIEGVRERSLHFRGVLAAAELSEGVGWIAPSEADALGAYLRDEITKLREWAADDSQSEHADERACARRWAHQATMLQSLLERLKVVASC